MNKDKDAKESKITYREFYEMYDEILPLIQEIAQIKCDANLIYHDHVADSNLERHDFQQMYPGQDITPMMKKFYKDIIGERTDVQSLAAKKETELYEILEIDMVQALEDNAKYLGSRFVKQILNEFSSVMPFYNISADDIRILGEIGKDRQKFLNPYELDIPEEIKKDFDCYEDEEDYLFENTDLFEHLEDIPEINLKITSIYASHNKNHDFMEEHDIDTEDDIEEER